MDQHQFEKEKTALVQTILGQYEWDNLAVTEPLSRIVGHDLPYSIKFKVVDIPGILRENIKQKDDFSKVISALKILKKYARNLQKPEELRPEKWHMIMYSNGTFKSSVDVIQGAREVLKTVGYKEEEYMYGLCFVKNTQPDQVTIAFVITELMIGLAEIEQYANGMATYHVHLDSLISPRARVPQQQQNYYSPIGNHLDMAREVDLRGAERAEASKKVMRFNDKVEPCEICGNDDVAVVCETCNQKWLCEECDQRYHSHPLRLDHVRSKIIRGMTSRNNKEPVESDEIVESLVGDLQSHLSMGESYRESYGESYSNSNGGEIRSLPSARGEIQSSRGEATEHTAIHSIASGQLPALSGVFNASNSAELISAHKSLQASSEARAPAQMNAGEAPYSELKMNPTGLQASNAFLNRIKSQPEMVNDFQRILMMDYRGPTCNLLTQIMSINPLEKQREVLDMCVIKLQMGIIQGGPVGDMNNQIVRQQLGCLHKYRDRWDVLVSQKTEELNQNQVPSQNQINSSESNGSGNVTFVININSHMNQTQNQAINIANANANFVPNVVGNVGQSTQAPNAGTMTSYSSAAGLPPMIPLHIEQPETSIFNQQQTPLGSLAIQDYNAQQSFAKQQPNRSTINTVVCETCQRITRTASQFCQHCGNRLEQNLNQTLAGNLGGQGLLSVSEPSNTTVGGNDKSPLLWQCAHCTYRNHPDILACEICQRVTEDPVWISEESEAIPTGPGTPGHSPANPAGQDFCQFDQEDRIEEQELIQQSLVYAQPMRENNRTEDEAIQGSQAKEFSPLRRRRDDKNVMTPLTMNVSNVTQTPPSQASTQPQRRSMMQETSTGFVYNLVGGDMSQVSPGGGGRSGSPAPETMPSILNSTKEDNKQMENQARQLACRIRDAEINNYSLEEFEIALDQCTTNDPISWLSLTWDQTVEEAKGVLTALTSGLDQAQFNFTDVQIRGKLAAHCGDVDKAVSELISERKEALEYLKALESFSDDQIFDALNSCHGNKDRAESHLVNSYLSEFQSAIWEPDPGITQEVESVIRDKDVDMQRRGRLVLVEGFLKSWGRVETVLYLLDYVELDPSISLDDIFDAANECGHKAATLQYLQQECQICFSSCSRNKIMNLTHCQCQVCQPCMQEYFEVVIRERPVRDLVCPVCLQPDIQDPEHSQQHFQFLDLLLKRLVQKDTLELYQRKVRDWILMQDPHFRWCSHCDSGFLFTPEEGEDDLQMACPHCAKVTCYKCQRPWEDQHAGLTCDQFTEWKIANDPEHQAQGLARHLQEYGIECPSCKFRYVLARGGCMHFKCTQCHHEFCSGCYKPFKRQNCQFLRSCAHAGLHCHHPRDCLFYLRDYEIEELQTLLKESSVIYNKEKNDELDGKKNSTCGIVEQKETASGLVDEECGKDVIPNHAGLCLLHYKEYLVGLVNRHNLDPVFMMTNDQLELQLKKYEKPNLKRKGKESDAAYRKRLIGHVQNQIPIVTKSRKNYCRS